MPQTQNKTRKQVREEKEAAKAATVKPSKELVDDIDSLLDEIDGCLEENEVEFLKNYVQKGGQ
jgi:ubiquitin-like protein Pup